MVQRDPSSWLGLLRWSTQYHDSTHESTMRPLSDEDRKFLEAALEAGSVDPTKHMADIVDAVTKLAASTDPAQETVETLFDELQGYVENLDLARDLHKIKKFEPLVNLLSCHHASIRAHTAYTLALLTQNDIQAQDNALQLSCLERLTHLAALDENKLVRQNSLFAVSCLIRGHPLAEDRFILEGDGFRLLANNIDLNESTNVRRRSLFLIHHLILEKNSRSEHLPFSELLPNILELVEKNLNDEEGGDEDAVGFGVQILGLLSSCPGEKTREALEKHQVVAFLHRMQAQATGDRFSEVLSEALRKATTPPQQTPQTPQQTQQTTPPQSQTTAAATASAPQERQQQTSATLNVFEATHEWKEVLPGQAIPKGLHVRLDMETGKRYARLLVEEDTSHEAGMAVVVAADAPSTTLSIPGAGGQ